MMKLMAKKIAKHIFDAGSDRSPDGKVNRIQFMGGKWPDNEIPMGGLNEIALASVIENAIEEIKSK